MFIPTYHQTGRPSVVEVHGIRSPIVLRLTRRRAAGLQSHFTGYYGPLWIPAVTEWARYGREVILSNNAGISIPQLRANCLTRSGRWVAKAIAFPRRWD